MCNHKSKHLKYSYSDSDTEQATATPEPTYELVHSSSVVKLEKNPAYSVSFAHTADHHYDEILTSYQ